MLSTQYLLPINNDIDRRSIRFFGERFSESKLYATSHGASGLIEYFKGES